MNKEKFRNLAIGETFYIGRHKFKVVKAEKNNVCGNCCICKLDADKYCCFDYCCEALIEIGIIPECTNRKDGVEVRFIKVKEEK